MFAVPSFFGFQKAGFGPTVDPDAQAFFDRVTAAGGTLSVTEQTATNQLVLDMKSAGIWTAMRAVYPMVGASAAACAQNLKSSSFTGTFTSGWTFASTGVKGNGSSTYMNTFLSPNTNIDRNSGHLSYYTNENVKVGAFQIGVFGGSAATMIGARFDATRNYIGVNGEDLIAELNNVNSFICLSRTNSTEFNYYKKNTLFATIARVSSAPNGNNIWLGALNLDNTAPFLPDTATCAFASIGVGLTNTENTNFYTAVQAFQTTLSRQV